MSDLIFHCGLYLGGVLISAIAQLMLKKSASKKAEKNIFTFTARHFPRVNECLRNSGGRLCRTIRKHEKLLTEYLNPFTVLSYVVFIAATFLTIFSYRVVPLSMAPILGTSEYFFVAVLSRLFMKERIGKKKALGLAIIILGAVVYTLGKPA